jgi:CheY-like chemotaxis protein/HPt (histidine-containing phosphotransfer) domain-containing protein
MRERTVPDQRGDGEADLVPVLLVEDSPSARILTAALLRRIGCEVEAVGDGERALQALDERPARVVFLDIGLPGLDGIETAKRIRQLPPPASNAVLVALSGYVDGSVPGAPAGLFDQSLAKPATRDRLAAAVAAAAESRRSVAAPVALPDGQWQVLAEMAVREMRAISLRLVEARQGGDVDEVRDAAHRLQGIAATFGSPEVARLAGELEMQARQHAALELSRELTDLCSTVLKATLCAIDAEPANAPQRTGSAR